MSDREQRAAELRAAGWSERNIARVLGEQTPALAPPAVAVCPCEGDADEPGEHIATCPWRDPDFDGVETPPLTLAEEIAIAEPSVKAEVGERDADGDGEELVDDLTPEQRAWSPVKKVKPKEAGAEPRRLTVLPVAELGSPIEYFRCVPYSSAITAATCIARQKAANAPWKRLTNPMAGGKDWFPKCKACALGRSVRAQLDGKKMPLASTEASS